MKLYGSGVFPLGLKEVVPLGLREVVPVSVRGGWNCTLQEVDFGEQLVTETLVVKKLQLFVDS